MAISTHILLLLILYHCFKTKKLKRARESLSFNPVIHGRTASSEVVYHQPHFTAGTKLHWNVVAL